MRRARAGQTKEQRFVSVLFRGPWRIDRRTSIRRRRGRRRNADGSGLAARASFDNIASACSSSRALVEIARERGPEKLGFSRRAAASDSEVGAIALRFSEHFLVLEVIRSFSVSLLRSLRSLRSSLSSSSSSSSIVMTGDEIPLAPPSPPLAGQQPATIAPATAQTPPPPPPLPPDDDTPWDLSHTTPAAFTHILKAAFTDGGCLSFFLRVCHFAFIRMSFRIRDYDMILSIAMIWFENYEHIPSGPSCTLEVMPIDVKRACDDVKCTPS